ncbi:hypothetical protein LPJ61_002696 [Coemansia biformis]|uniref:Muniscin C-terminal domain-containing protein n=1 Tax=Coemansia biformis TaxID=1286918 RepID=A0A9W8CW72_9FUNG|nr:hypothetical protein LPJ61_002696 [Coemansia biformis]
MHLHLAERISTQVVEPLEAFSRSDVWRSARAASKRVQQLASEMRNHHEQIPKLSARTASKASRSSQQARLDAEKRQLLELQQEWQAEIADLVGEFESVDAARFEHVRESVLKYEHYRSEFFKTAHARTTAATAAAQGLQARQRVADAVVRPAGARAETAGAWMESAGEHVDADDAEDKGGPKGFLKLGIFRSKTKRIKKKPSAASHSIASSDVSAHRAASSVTSPDIGRPATVLSVRTAHGTDALDSEPSAGASTSAARPRRSSDRGNSFVSSRSTQQLDGNTESTAPTSAGTDDRRVSAQEGSCDTAEWILAGHSQGSPDVLADSGLSADSLVHVNRLSVIDESSDKTHGSPLHTQHDEPAATAQSPPESPLHDAQPDHGEGAGSSADTEPPRTDPATAPQPRFDDLFSPLVLRAPTESRSHAAASTPAATDSVASTNVRLDSTQVDLDSAFALPPPRSQASTDSNTATATAEPQLLAASEAVGTAHRRNTSMGAGESLSAGGTSEPDDEAAEVEQTFRVNFSIRERAIQDNPDETKAALTRVTTMLRAAPSSGRRNRREVRTMYVSSDAPFVGSTTTPVSSSHPEAAPGITADAKPDVEPNVEPEANPESFVDERAEASTDLAPVMEGEDIGQSPRTLSAMSKEGTEEHPERGIPVATATVPDVDAPAVIEASAVPESEGMTTAPVDDGAEKDTEQSAVADQSTVAEQTLPSAKSQHLKGDGSVRRRAPPPPPPSSHPSYSGTAAPPAQSAAAPTVGAAESSSDSDAVSDMSAYRGRRAGATSGPLTIAMEVQEVLDFRSVLRGEAVEEVDYRVTGEIAMHIQASINPLELAPLRICAQRAETTQWVANPAVVVLDASLTAAMDDGREWYRFVRPDLFAQATGAMRVPVFKFERTGRNDQRVVPVKIICATTRADDGCGLIIFCEPNTEGHFGGSTVEEPAVLLGLEGNVTSQASRPTAVWFRERNSLLWKLDPMHVPRSKQAVVEGEEQAQPQSLAVKVQGTNVQAGALALKFVARNVRIVNIPLCIVRVTSGMQTTQTVVDGPSVQVVRSGKCTYASMIDLAATSEAHQDHQPDSSDSDGGDGESSSGDSSDSAVVGLRADATAGGGAAVKPRPLPEALSEVSPETSTEASAETSASDS